MRFPETWVATEAEKAAAERLATSILAPGSIFYRMNQLQNNEKTMIVRTHIENLNIVRECIKQNGPIRSDDIAKMTGVSIATVRNIIKNTRKDIKGDIYIGAWGMGACFYGKYCIGNKMDVEKPMKSSHHGDELFNDRARKKALNNRPEQHPLMAALFQHVWGVKK